MALPPSYAFLILSQVSSSSMSSLQQWLVTGRFDGREPPLKPLGREGQPSEDNLLWYPASEGMQVSPGVASGEVIATSDFQIGLLDQGWPDETGVASVDYVQRAVG